MIYFGKLAILNSSRVIRENLSQDVASKHDIEMIKVTTSVMHILRFHPRCRIGQKITRRNDHAFRNEKMATRVRTKRPTDGVERKVNDLKLKPQRIDGVCVGVGKRFLVLGGKKRGQFWFLFFWN